MSTLTGVLSKLLADANISEAELSRLVDLPRATINRLTGGKTPDPRISTLKTIAAHFNISVEQLLGEKPIFNTATECATSLRIPLLEWNDLYDWKTKIAQATPSHKNWISIDDTKDNNKIAVVFEGESMWPQFSDRSILIIDTQKEVKNRDFVLVHINKTDEILFRQLLLEQGCRIVRPLNNLFKTYVLNEKDRIIGTLSQTRTSFI